MCVYISFSGAATRVRPRFMVSSLCAYICPGMRAQNAAAPNGLDDERRLWECALTSTTIQLARRLSPTRILSDLPTFISNPTKEPSSQPASGDAELCFFHSPATLIQIFRRCCCFCFGSFSRSEPHTNVHIWCVLFPHHITARR